MSLLQDTGIVLRRHDYSETSQILVVLTRGHGKVSLLGKGVKRGTRNRFAAAIDLLEVGQLVWSHRPDKQRTLAILTEWKPRRSFGGLRESLGRLYAAQYAAEITSQLLKEHDPHADLFDNLLDSLERLESSDRPLDELTIFQRRLLVSIGLMFQLERCATCGCELGRRPAAQAGVDRLYFSSHQGGFVCRDCETGHVEKRAADMESFRQLIDPPVHGVSEGVFDLFNYHLSHLIGHEPKLAELISPSIVRRCLS